MVDIFVNKITKIKTEQIFEKSIDNRTNVRYSMNMLNEQMFGRAIMMKVISFIHKYNRLLVTLVIAFLFISIFTLGSKTRENTANASTINVKYFKCISIGADDTLWSIASENISEEYESVDDYINEVKCINGLNNDKIYCGATLVIPYYDAP